MESLVLEDYFKPPFYLDRALPFYILSQPNLKQQTVTAFTWCCDLGWEAKEKVVRRLNGEEPGKPKGVYSEESGYIYFNTPDGRKIKLLVVRGWGMLIGGGCFGLPSETAIKIQSLLLEYALKQLNNETLR